MANGNIKHIVVLMMENRSFDHMLGALMKEDARINGLTGNEFNPDTKGAEIKVKPDAKFQGQLDPDPDHHFPGVNLQLYHGTDGPPETPSMKGFILDYFEQRRDVKHSHNIMNYFTPDKLPVLAGLARSYALFNGWFASIPGPTLCNRAFSHYGTSFGQVGMDIFYWKGPYLSIYERMIKAGRSAKLYYFDEHSSSLEVANLFKNQPQLFGTYEQFLADCKAGLLPDYSYIEPNYSDHEGDGGEVLANDQHPDHNVQAGEIFIASVYNAIRTNPDLWKSTALLITYDEHGGIYDHVPPPPCTPDGFVASAADTGTRFPFAFDRLGVRVPALLISPWVPRGTVIPGTEDLVNGRIFEHASIPATVTSFFLGDYDNRSPREKAASTFMDLITDQMRPEEDCPLFDFE
ncbi:MAG: phosphoesterase [Blastocatellia bacterium AA13]|nr:MAG: phosphoesterase [Blastocatellia bacterium AA13]